MAKNTFIIRVDSSAEIGAGHLSRCLVLANALAKNKADIIFICRAHHGSLHKLIIKEKFKLHLLKGKKKEQIYSIPSDWLGCSQLQDALESAVLIDQYPGSHVIVDHYSLDYVWESNINCKSMTVIDDLADRRHKCSLLIDQSLKNTKLNYVKLVEGNFDFIGGNLVILRDEFVGQRAWEPSGNNRLLICMGGADPQRYTKKILESIILSHKKDRWHQGVSEINVIVGPACSDLEELSHLTGTTKLKVSILPNAENIAQLMLMSDLCILSCGTMILEACALGVPSIGIIAADNQKKTAEFLADAGAIKLYNFGNDKGLIISEDIHNLILDPKKRLQLSNRSKKMVSANSIETIVRSLCEV